MKRASLAFEMRRRGKWFSKPKPIVVPVVKVVTKPPRVMLAANEYHHGTAAWKYELGAWTCFKASDALAFMVKQPVDKAQLEMTRRGFTHVWL